MAAPVENQYWRQRASHGRTATFATADELLNAAYDYFQWSDDNPWQKVEQMKRPTITKDRVGDVEISTVHSIVHLPMVRPYTLKGLCLHLGAGESWWRELKQAKSNDAAFLEALSRIEDIIYTQKFEGAVVGAFNANIISRDLGLIDKKSLDAKVSVEQITGMEIL